MSDIIPVPLPGELEERKNNGYSNEEALRLATDLFYVATELDKYPTDPMEQRLIKEAVMQMAWYLQESHENQEAVFSPFSSERVGSYSYSKMQKTVQDGNSTGLDWFDRAVNYFKEREQYEGALFGAASEQVFVHGINNSSRTALWVSERAERWWD